MKPYEINKLVAEKVMGWEYDHETDTFIISRNEEGINYLDANPLGDHYFSPTTNHKDALQVAEKFIAYDICKRPDGYSANVVYKRVDGWVYASGESASMAICLAALKAVGVEVEGTE